MLARLEAIAEMLEDLRVAAAPTVDRLLQIADREEAARAVAARGDLRGERPDRLPLGATRVLELVEEQVLDLRVDPFEQLRIGMLGQMRSDRAGDAVVGHFAPRREQPRPLALHASRELRRRLGATQGDAFDLPREASDGRRERRLDPCVHGLVVEETSAHHERLADPLAERGGPRLEGNALAGSLHVANRLDELRRGADRVGDPLAAEILARLGFGRERFEPLDKRGELDLGRRVRKHPRPRGLRRLLGQRRQRRRRAAHQRFDAASGMPLGQRIERREQPLRPGLGERGDRRIDRVERKPRCAVFIERFERHRQAQFRRAAGRDPEEEAVEGPDLQAVEPQQQRSQQRKTSRRRDQRGIEPDRLAQRRPLSLARVIGSRGDREPLQNAGADLAGRGAGEGRGEDRLGPRILRRQQDAEVLRGQLPRLAGAGRGEDAAMAKHAAHASRSSPESAASAASTGSCNRFEKASG